MQLVSFYFRLQDYYLLWCSLPPALSSGADSMSLSHNPSCYNNWFRLFPVRSPLLRESIFLSLPPATKMFQFAGLAHTCLCIQQAVFQVAPFGHLRLNACCQLPGAFRWSPRPSSPLCAKVFTVSRIRLTTLFKHWCLPATTAFNLVHSCT